MASGIAGEMSIPDWVPAEVIDFYWYLYDEGRPNHPELTDRDIEILYYCLASPDMKKAWKALSKRSDISDPRAFAYAIVATSKAIREPTPLPSKHEIESWKKLSKAVESLQVKFDAAMKNSTGNWRRFWIGEYEKLHFDPLLWELGFTVRIYERWRRESKERSGKPKSKNSQRTFVVRLLSDWTWELYGQPLHAVVAATGGIILDEDIDPELARKLMAGYKYSERIPANVPPDEFWDWLLDPEDF